MMPRTLRDASGNLQGHAAVNAMGPIGRLLLALSSVTVLLELTDVPLLDTGKQLFAKVLWLIAIPFALSRYRPADTRPWLCLWLFFLFTGLLKLMYFGSALVGQRWVDLLNSRLDLALYLVASLANLAASIWFMRIRRPRGDWALTDAWVIGSGILLAFIRWVTIPIYVSQGFDSAFLNVGIVELIEMLAIVPLVAIAFSEPVRNRSFQLYLLGMSIVLVSLEYFYAVHGTEIFAGMTKTTALFCASLGRTVQLAAVLHPSMRDMAVPSTESRPPWNARRNIGILAAVCAPVVSDVLAAPIPQSAHHVFMLGLGVMLIAIVTRLRLAVLDAHRVARDLRMIAHHDQLTGLPNRRFVHRTLARCLDIQMKAKGAVALVCCYIDIDNLKDVNDRMGHYVGDRLIQSVAGAIRELPDSENATAVRMGGDEFLVLATLPGDRIDVEARRIADDITQVVNSLIVAPDIVQTRASVGAAWMSLQLEGGAVLDQLNHLIDRADLAQVEAKREGGARVRYFRDALSVKARRDTTIHRDISGAWLREEMFLDYQPVVHLADRQIYGAESLLRWRHPELGFISPPEAISAAEQQGTISELGLQILERAIEDLASVSSSRQVRVGVNLSGQQLKSASLEKIIELIGTKNLGARLWLEITEQEVVEARDIAADALRELRRRGVVVAIDDFGTGYCGLDYLCTLPVDIVKLDGVFARNSKHSQTRRRIAQLGVQLAESVGAIALAEGIEDVETAEIMRDLGCSLGQGYAFRRPIANLLSATDPLQTTRA